MTIGINKGSTYTKTSKGAILKSTVRSYNDSEMNLNNDKKIQDHSIHRMRKMD
ncbi:hypothetical protein [Brassicibacter mesophilus]|uniref:hypothetical protein n=1 Tax=Brassicibacter mesophilus TaxID=745119 RepID=UPI003D25151B